MYVIMYVCEIQKIYFIFDKYENENACILQMRKFVAHKFDFPSVVYFETMYNINAWIHT